MRNWRIAQNKVKNNFRRTFKTDERENPEKVVKKTCLISSLSFIGSHSSQNNMKIIY